MTINLSIPDNDLKPRITVVGVGGAGGNAVNNMVRSALAGVEFIACNTDAQALQHSLADHKIQLGQNTTRGLGAGSRPEIGRMAAEEALEEIMDYLKGCNMVFITAGMGGGTGTGAAPIIAKAARENDILTVGVVTKPFHFEGTNRMRLAESGIKELQKFVDTLLIIPNQNLFRVANEQTTLAEAFKMADDVLHAGVRGVTDLMIMPGLINLDFADIRTVMGEMGKAMMGTGEAGGDKRSIEAAEAAISNPLLDDVSMRGAKGVLINITGGPDMTLFEVDEAANRIREEVDPESNIIFGSTFDEKLQGRMRISVVATGIDAEISRKANEAIDAIQPAEPRRAGQFVPQQPNGSSEEVPVPLAATAETVTPLFSTKKANDPGDIPSFARVVAAANSAPRDAQDGRFVVPPPVSPPTMREQGEHQPLSTSRSTHARERAMPPPVAPSLFRRMLGGGRPQPVPPLQRIQANYGAGRPPAEAAPGPVSEKDAGPQSVEGDYLDIPAFLRRQAN